MLDSPISELNPYCKYLAKKLANLNLKTVRDVLFYYPFRYENLSNIKKINELAPGELATIKVRLELIQNYRSPRQHKKITEAIASDDSGKIKILWFNQWFLTKTLFPGDQLYLTAKLNNNYTKELISPEYEKASGPSIHTGRIVPIYSLTQGLTQKQLRTAINIACQYVEDITEYLPEEIIKEKGFLGIKDALLNIHFPSSLEMQKQAIERLSFDETFFLQLKNAWLKKELKQKVSSKLPFHKEKIADFVKNLPFELTDAQKRSAWQILQDIEKTNPMNRLLNGDVGSGKTIVCALGIYNCALSGTQSALMAPTEILASQHYKTFWGLFKKLGLNIALLTRSFSLFNNEKISKKKLIEKIANGEAHIIIGTHALIQESIKFNNLSLAVIDEQHRFGVEQRGMLAKLNSKKYPHLLAMTATPIPRTLSLITCGDLDISLINEMPKGRKIIKTYVVGPHKRQGAYNFIGEQIKSGRQIFVICPLINESDKLGVQSVSEEYKKLKEKIFPNLSIEMLHGKLKASEKEEIMQKFKDNKTQILVSTSVVEVGVDIPNATIMMIEGAERFGLSQLHQFRGRVGRGKHQSYCLLFPTIEPTMRLRSMEQISDGFRLAEIDLELRGPGQIYGKEQSGKIEFKIANINNFALLEKAQNTAKKIFNNDSELKKYPHLHEYLEKKLKNIHLG